MRTRFRQTLTMGIGVARTCVRLIAAISVFVVTAQLDASPGKIVVANDEWTLSDSGFTPPNDPGRFATNVARWFTGGPPGSFLAYSDNYGLTGAQLAAAMTGAGNLWTVSTAVPFDLATLALYDGVFVGGYPADASVLTAYVEGGGNVYLFGGAGWLGSLPDSDGSVEAAAWNPFLNEFGLGLSVYNGIWQDVPISNTHPIFEGVDSLNQGVGQSILDLEPADPANQVLVIQGTDGLYAIYEIPEPAALSLLALGGLALVRRRRN